MPPTIFSPERRPLKSKACNSPNEQLVEVRVRRHSLEHDAGDDVAREPEGADDEDGHALQPELERLPHVAVVRQGLVALVDGLGRWRRGREALEMKKSLVYNGCNQGRRS